MSMESPWADSAPASMVSLMPQAMSSWPERVAWCPAPRPAIELFPAAAATPAAAVPWALSPHGEGSLRS